MVLARYGERGRGLHDWLMQLEAQRYAGAANASAGTAELTEGAQTQAKTQTQLRQLRQQFGRLAWPA
jgi:protein-glutamine gamma-glutamyltransferase